MLQIDNRIINTPILTIIKQLKSELTNGKLIDVKDKHSYISVTCPYHSNGVEKHASCSVYCGEDKNIPYGTCHCFTCGFKGTFTHFIGQCLDGDENLGKEWLLARFGISTFRDPTLYLPKIETKKSTSYLDENILSNFQSYHPYMTQRNLTQEVIKKFNIKYDPKTQCIIFPIYDEHNKLKMLTKRSVNSKFFEIDENIEKPVYLLNHIKNEHIKTVYVCESQINALTLWGWDKPAIALIGTGSTNQFKILNKTEINHYILALDGDLAGHKGILKFLTNINLNSLVSIVITPPNKDVNDLTKEEFEALPVLSSWEWLTKNNLKIENFKLI